jgi:hypothetical protein
MTKIDENNNTKGTGPDEDFYQVESETGGHIKPAPVADHTHFVFNDLKKGQIRHGNFILRNIGGKYQDYGLSLDDPGSILTITNTAPLDKNQVDRLPLEIFFEVFAPDWSKQYRATIIIRLDGQEEKVIVELDTQTKPVNDFAKLFNFAETKKITALIKKLEKTTGAEIAVVTVESLEGQTIEEYTSALFNEWGIGKEDRHNGILFLICTEENKYRIGVGLGLEELLDERFINTVFEKYVIPNFKISKFGVGVFEALGAISARIITDFKKTSTN